MAGASGAVAREWCATVRSGGLWGLGMRDEVRAAVAVAKDQIEIQRFPRPQLGPKDLLIRLALCGVCGSDPHLVRGDWPTPYPLVIGHEMIGTVEEATGEAESHHGVRVGDHVAIDMLVPCRACFFCQSGLPNLCERDMKEGWQLGCSVPTTRAPALWGGWAEMLYLPAEAAVFRVPETIPWNVAVLTEPLAVCCRAVRLTRPRLGDTAVVVGAGAIGLLSVVAAKAGGAQRVILVGSRANRLELGLALGADEAVDVRAGNALAEVLELTGGRGADVVFETAGTVEAQQRALPYARRGGTVTFIGMTGGKTVGLNIDAQIVEKELRLQGSNLSAGAYPAAIGILARGDLPFERLVTHTFPLAEAATALQTSVERLGDSIKVVIDPRA